jgi:hypothetical protein
MLRHLEESKDDRELITRLGQVKLTVAEAALGASVMQAKPVSDALKLREWDIFLAIHGLEDDRRDAASRIWRDLDDVLKSDEHALALAVRLGELRKSAISLLARPARLSSEPTGGGSGTTGAGTVPPERSQPVVFRPGPVVAWVGSDLGEVEAFYGGDHSRVERNRRLVLELKSLYGRSQVEADDLPSWMNAEATTNLLEVHLVRRLVNGGSDERSNMVVLTPTLHALVHLDPGVVIDFQRGILESPKFGLKAKVRVKPNHNG